MVVVQHCATAVPALASEVLDRWNVFAGQSLSAGGLPGLFGGHRQYRTDLGLLIFPLNVEDIENRVGARVLCPLVGSTLAVPTDRP